MSNTTDKLMGSAKEAVGKATGNEKLETKGKIQHDAADFREKIEEVADTATSKVHDAVSDDRRDA